MKAVVAPERMNRGPGVPQVRGRVADRPAMSQSGELAVKRDGSVQGGRIRPATNRRTRRSVDLRRLAVCVRAVLRTRTAVALVTTAVSLGSLAAATLPAHASTARDFAVSKYPDINGKYYVLRWDPCGPAIGYQVNVDTFTGEREKAAAVRETKSTIGRLAKASGLRFTYTGRTSYIPRTGNEAKQTAPLVVAFVKPSQTDYPLAGRTSGYGGTRTGWVDEVTYVPKIVGGYVVIDAPQTMHWSRSTTRGGLTRPAMIAHELGHAVGLDHVYDPTQTMNPSVSASTPLGYGSGDKAGLRKVGAAAGCLGEPLAQSARAALAR